MVKYIDHIYPKFTFLNDLKRIDILSWYVEITNSSGLSVLLQPEAGLATNPAMPLIPFIHFDVYRGSASTATTGLGVDKASNLTQEDAEDEFSAYRKRMMLAYRFRPNPLVSYIIIKHEQQNKSG